MIYIICAFEAEARALIEGYKLNKKESAPFKLFGSEEAVLIISGMGQERAKEALQYLFLHYPNTQEDIFINLGTCAGANHLEVGTLVQVKHLQNEESSHLLAVSDNTSITPVSCFSAKLPLDRPTATDIAEMEAMAIYSLVQHYFPRQKISFLKIVSDHFNPVKPSKSFVIKLVHSNLKLIKNHIHQMQEY